MTLNYWHNEFDFDASTDEGEGLDGFLARGTWIDGDTVFAEFAPLPDAEDVRVYRWGSDWATKLPQIQRTLAARLLGAYNRYWTEL